MNRKIIDFNSDAEGHWFAILECGHNQHTRHNPPWEVREWVISEEGRAAFIGKELNCVLCDEMGLGAPVCKCGNNQSHKLVAPRPEYKFFSYFLMCIGISSCPVRVKFQCLLCGHVFETIDKPEDCNKYRYR